jgi:hypothetical protein
MTTLRFAVGTVVGLIEVCLSSELIIVAIATDVQSKFNCGFEILEKSFGGGETAGDRTGIVYRQKYESPTGYAMRTPVNAQLIATSPGIPAQCAVYSQL